MPTPNFDLHANELHQQAIVIDGHSDILMAIADNKARLGAWLRLPDPATWQPPLQADWKAEQFHDLQPHTLYFGSAGQYSLPQFRAGGLTVQICAIYLEDKQLGYAVRRGLEMTWWLQREMQENPGLELVRTNADISRLKQEGKCGAILSFEGLEPLGPDLWMLDLYYRLGLRMASLTHNRRNLYADGVQNNAKPGGLTELGKQAIRRMNELGIVIDLVHLNEIGFWEVLELTQAPVVFSHTSPYCFSRPPHTDPPHPGFVLRRDRGRLEALARNGGMLGVIFFDQGELDKVVDDIEFLLELIGPDHVGLGSDYYGAQFAPRGLEDISKMPAITRALVKRGHSDEVILKILGGNFMRVFEQVWKPA
jgi:membrane dipeptidase